MTRTAARVLPLFAHHIFCVACRHHFTGRSAQAAIDAYLGHTCTHGRAS